MDEITIEENEWSFEEEVYGETRLGIHEVRVRCEEGIEAARAQDIDLAHCYASRISIKSPHITKDTVDTLSRIFPSEVWTKSRVYWNLGFDHYQYDREAGCHDVTIYLVDRHLDLDTYTGPGACKPPVKMRYHRFPMQVIETPEWIQYERTRRPGSSLPTRSQSGGR